MAKIRVEVDGPESASVEKELDAKTKAHLKDVLGTEHFIVVAFSHEDAENVRQKHNGEANLILGKVAPVHMHIASRALQTVATRISPKGVMDMMLKELLGEIKTEVGRDE